MRRFLACLLLALAVVTPVQAAPIAPPADTARLVVLIWTGDRAIIATVDPDGRTRPRLEVPDPAGTGPMASLSPDGSRLAITVADRPGTGAPGKLLIGDLRTGTLTPRLDGIDPAAAPVWSPATDRVLVRLPDNSVWVVTVDGGEPSQVASPGGGESLFLAGWAASGPVVLAISKQGSVLRLIGGTDLFLTAEPVRDVRVGPNDVIAFGTLGTAETPPRIGIVRDGTLTYTAGAGPFIHPAWRPDGTLTVAGLPAQASRVVAGSITTVHSGAGEKRSFDLPVSWSPDGRLLAVRTVWYADDGRPISETVAMISADGRRTPVRASGYLEALGWSGS